MGTYVDLKPDVKMMLKPLESSAKNPLSSNQKLFFLLVPGLLIAGLLSGIHPMHYLLAFVTVMTISYLGLLAFNVFLVLSSARKGALLDVEADLEHLDRDDLPTYAVMVPLYKETWVLDDLIHNLCQLEYPVDKLKILLLLEGDDTEMIQAVNARELPAHFKVLLVPPSQPRTKPKALNIGLQHIKAEYIVVYDAEDKPEPDQLLKAVAAFRKLGPEVVCLQAMLAYHNPHQNLLTRFFAAEYASWFTLYIPGLAHNGWLFLLGGTSNHFRTWSLRKIGAWDPYNVTEDADLGIRIARAGYQVRAIKSITWEEANSRPISWVKQRSRWIKGYMQTYLAHMRHPLRLWQQMGWKRFIAFQFMVGVAPFSTLINPVFWTFTADYLLTRWEFIEQLFPFPLIYLGAISLLAGNMITIYISLTGSLLQRDFGGIKWMLLTPVYWVLMSIAAWKALQQLIFKPHYWEKTQHGLRVKSNITVT